MLRLEIEALQNADYDLDLFGCEGEETSASARYPSIRGHYNPVPSLRLFATRSANSRSVPARLRSTSTASASQLVGLLRFTTTMEVSMLVKDIMTKNVNSCRPDNNLAEVVETMWKQRCGALPILDGSARVIGMITDRDVCIALGTRNMKASDVLARDVSPPGCFSCNPVDDVRDALRLIATEDVCRLPVVDDAGHLLGILSIDDIVFRAGGGCSNLCDREIVETLRALWEDRIHERSQTTREEQNLQSHLRMPLNYAPERFPFEGQDAHELSN